MGRICFDASTRRPNFLDTASDSCQWENLKNKRKKKKHKESKQGSNFFCNFTFFTIITFRGELFTRKISFSPTALHILSSKVY